MPYWFSKVLLWRVSSQAIASTLDNTASARMLMSA